MYLYIIGGIAILLAIYVLIEYNNFISLQNSANEAFSTMDIYLKKRWDLIPNLIETVKGYAEHEKDTLENITTLRSNIYDNMSMGEKQTSNEQIAQALPKIMSLAENYPDLKANENFLKLSDQLMSVENDIANSRKYYNGNVRLLNNKVQMIPSNIIASIFNVKEMKMFEANTNERENVKGAF